MCKLPLIFTPPIASCVNLSKLIYFLAGRQSASFPKGLGGQPNETLQLRSRLSAVLGFHYGTLAYTVKVGRQQPMESSKAFDVPRVLTPESDTRLLRVFHFLRQPSHRARAAAATAASRKKAEILERSQEQTSGPAAVPRERDETATIAECSNQQDLVAVELDRLLQDAAVVATENQAQMIVVRQDLGQLPRLSDHDTSGSISAADLSAALKAMDRPTPKARSTNDRTCG